MGVRSEGFAEFLHVVERNEENDFRNRRYQNFERMGYLEPFQYRDVFSAGIEPRGEFPLQEHDLGGIGEQMSWLTEQAAQATARIM